MRDFLRSMKTVAFWEKVAFFLGITVIVGIFFVTVWMNGKKGDYEPQIRVDTLYVMTPLDSLRFQALEESIDMLVDSMHTPNCSCR